MSRERIQQKKVILILKVVIKFLKLLVLRESIPFYNIVFLIAL